MRPFRRWPAWMQRAVAMIRYLLLGALIMVAIGVLVRVLLIGFELRDPDYWGGAFDAWKGCALVGALFGAACYAESERSDWRRER